MCTCIWVPPGAASSAACPPLSLLYAPCTLDPIAVQDTEERRYREMFQNHGRAFADLLDPDTAPMEALPTVEEASAPRPSQSVLQPAVLRAIVSCHAAVYAQVGHGLPIHSAPQLHMIRASGGVTDPC